MFHLVSLSLQISLMFCLARALACVWVLLVCWFCWVGCWFFLWGNLISITGSFQLLTDHVSHLSGNAGKKKDKEAVAQSEVDAFMENCAKRWQTREGTYQLKRRRLKPDVRDSPEYPGADIDMADI